MKRLVTIVSPGGKETPMMIEDNYVPRKGYTIKCEECACEATECSEKLVNMEEVEIVEIEIEKPKKKTVKRKVKGKEGK